MNRDFVPRRWTTPTGVLKRDVEVVEEKDSIK